MARFFPSIQPSLPERIQKNRTTGSSAIIEEPYPPDFPCLLRLGYDRSSKKYHYNKD
jgi:hypothetical protein